MPETQKIIDKFIAAHLRVYGTKPTIESKGGWHKINGEKSVRLADLESMTRSLVHTKPVVQNIKSLESKTEAKAQPKTEAKAQPKTEAKAQPKAKAATKAIAKKARVKPIKKERKATSRKTKSKVPVAFKNKKFKNLQGIKLIKKGNGLKPIEHWAAQIQKQQTQPSYPQGILYKK